MDRTEMVEKEYPDMKRGRILGYTLGGLGAAGAVTNIYFATQAHNEDAEVGLGVLAGIGTYFSITLILQLAFEFSSIDTQNPVSIVELKETKLSRCENAPAAFAKVRLLPMAEGKPLRNGWEVIESMTDKDGTAIIPLDSLPPKKGATYAVEVNGTIVTHVEVPAATATAVAPAPVQQGPVQQGPVQQGPQAP